MPNLRWRPASAASGRTAGCSPRGTTTSRPCTTSATSRSRWRRSIPTPSASSCSTPSPEWDDDGHREAVERETGQRGRSRAASPSRPGGVLRHFSIVSARQEACAIYAVLIRRPGAVLRATLTSSEHPPTDQGGLRGTTGRRASSDRTPPRGAGRETSSEASDSLDLYLGVCCVDLLRRGHVVHGFRPPAPGVSVRSHGPAGSHQRQCELSRSPDRSEACRGGLVDQKDTTAARGRSGARCARRREDHSSGEVHAASGPPAAVGLLSGMIRLVRAHSGDPAYSVQFSPARPRRRGESFCRDVRCHPWGCTCPSSGYRRCPLVGFGSPGVVRGPVTAVSTNQKANWSTKKIAQATNEGVPTSATIVSGADMTTATSTARTCHGQLRNRSPAVRRSVTTSAPFVPATGLPSRQRRPHNRD